MVVRPALRADEHQITNLLFFSPHIHRHLDWRTPLDWLGFPRYWALEEYGQIHAILACPEDPPGISWIRLFAHSSLLSGPQAWSPLWEALLGEIGAAGGGTVAAIVNQYWLSSLLYASGFDVYQYIVLLEWQEQPFSAPPVPPHVRIRPMRAEDLLAVSTVDAAAFAPLWRNSLLTTQRAYSQAMIATVAELEGEVVGYQISTSAHDGGHLARLAVRPEAQGLGIGAALVSDLILRLRQRGGRRLSVNTQANNAASLALYQKLGFVRTGEEYPVFIYPVKERE
jgi:ribosomal-protein-alanine N-acetyltransferase